MGRRGIVAAASYGALAFAGTPAQAAEGLDGATLGFVWAVPFIGMLLSIALAPLYPHAWEHHQGKIAAAWAVAAAVPLALSRGFGVALEALLHTLLLEYLPFILLLLALFTAAGGIVLFGSLRGTPATNTLLLAIGGLLASWVGTTGASMVLIRPVLRANDDRRYNAHVVVFFIFIVSNIGGALTPLGDPPLFLGFLRGVDFFWTTTHLAAETLFVAVIVLAVFYALDFALYRREEQLPPLPDPTPETRLRLRGLVNLGLIGVIIAAILMSAWWKPGISIAVHGVHLELQNLLRDAVMVGVTFASLALTAPVYREANGFSWGPIKEVAKLFAGIFITIIPVIAMLRAGPQGAFAPLFGLVTAPDGTPVDAAYFWLTGALSSFLDNAPTYLVFFELAGGDPARLMGPLAKTLAAISCGAVFMGANSYIGNAPNFMVYAIARHWGVRMPNFFAYMLWSGAILLPVFVLTTFVFFR
ncbi:MAG TPA: sodium:proton antiporter [Chloroflexota bacterium]|nr:sodium:proton antiporter [Chloroflexota bacterium]